MRRAAFAVLAVVALAGCGSTKIDDKKVEDLIDKNVREQVGARVKSVQCPGGLTAKQGATFECTVTGTDGTTGMAEVTGKDDEGNVSISAPFLHVRDYERQIAGGISDQTGSDVEVSCPEIIVGAKGGTFECDATSGSEEAKVTVTQTDDQGHVRYEVGR